VFSKFKSKTMTHETLKAEVLSFVEPYQDPITDQSVVSLLKNIDFEHPSLRLQFQLPYPFAQTPAYLQDLKHDLCQHLLTCTDTIQVVFDVKTLPLETIRQSIPSLNKVKHVIAVASGKGGVGKSTTAINLALALQYEGLKVGVLDADIYGPSMPILCGLLDHELEITPDNKMHPAQAFGLAVQSIGFLVKPEQAQIWRGPMAAKTLQQMIQETQWPELDVLVVDLPPGTGDIQLTLSQKLNLSGAIVVTTPQDLATADAKKGIAMFNQVEVPVLGLIENMSYYQCSACGHHDSIFGCHGGDTIAKKYQLPLLLQMPLHRAIQADADQGRPTVVNEPAHAFSKMYRKAAQKTMSFLSHHTQHQERMIFLTNNE
jgi:ATP-binding protein involved in chromosome partitioning